MSGQRTHQRVSASVWDIPPSGGADDFRCSADGQRWPCGSIEARATLLAEIRRDVEGLPGYYVKERDAIVEYVVLRPAVLAIIERLEEEGKRD